MSETKPICTLGFQDNLISLERFVICDTLCMKFSNTCLIFPSHAFFIGADEERVCIQVFETSKISERIFQKQTLVSEGLIILGKYVLAPEFLYEKQRCGFKHTSFDKLEPYGSKKES